MSIHDVAPATWSDCLHLLHAVRAVADIPLSWLVVPCYHHNAMRSLACEATLEKLMGEGHELVLHGYTHVDRVPLRGIGPGRLLRTLYTQREGEFAAIGRDEARRRLTLGMRWFQERAWPVSGFVALSLAAGAARLAGLARVSVPLHHQLCAFSLAAVGAQPGGAWLLVYAARNAGGRILSPPLASGMAALQRGAPLVRLALHPRDARHPLLVRHAQHLIERLLVNRTAMTKQAFAERMAGGCCRSVRYPAGAKTPVVACISRVVVRIAVALHFLLGAELQHAAAPLVRIDGIAELAASGAVDLHHAVHFDLHVGRLLLRRGAPGQHQECRQCLDELCHRCLLS
ncbi:DUF2334 domain-containing protein [Massilia sp. H-1]|nr:DUF2334 domain-containing protein [Massilia sp. H-1]